MPEFINPRHRRSALRRRETPEKELLDSLRAHMRRSQARWARVRLRIARQFIEAFRPSAESIAHHVMRQMGKPVEGARREITRAGARRGDVRARAAALADAPLPPKERLRRSVRHEPLGVVLDIPTWNHPLFPTRT